MANMDSLLSVICALLKILISFSLLKRLSALATVSGQFTWTQQVNIRIPLTALLGWDKLSSNG